MRGETAVPFANRRAMRFLQDKDPDLRKVKDYLLTGKRPHVKNTGQRLVKTYLMQSNNLTIAKDGCLVSNTISRNQIRRERLVIPDNISQGLLYALHWNLGHPTATQLAKMVNTFFLVVNLQAKVNTITKDCTICQSVATIPKELQKFDPNQVPDHPGKSFTVDVLRQCRKFAMITVDNFSGFISSCFIPSERQEHLRDGLLTTTLPFRSSKLAQVRVDQAPGFKAMVTSKLLAEELRTMGMVVDLGEFMNKNALAIADKKMKELEDQLKRLAPSPNMFTTKMLTQATAQVNEKIRSSGLSAKEILFARDQLSSKNLQLEDQQLHQQLTEDRGAKQTVEARSQGRKLPPATPTPGQTVFLKQDGNKITRRDLHLVLATDGEYLTVCKLPHALSTGPATFAPHNTTYKVKTSQVYLAPNQPSHISLHTPQAPPQQPPHQTQPEPPNFTPTQTKAYSPELPPRPPTPPPQSHWTATWVELDPPAPTDESTGPSPDTSPSSSQHSHDQRGELDSNASLVHSQEGEDRHTDVDRDDTTDIENSSSQSGEEADIEDGSDEDDPFILAMHNLGGDYRDPTQNPSLPPTVGREVQYYHPDRAGLVVAPVKH